MNIQEFNRMETQSLLGFIRPSRRALKLTLAFLLGLGIQAWFVWLSVATQAQARVFRGEMAGLRSTIDSQREDVSNRLRLFDTNLKALSAQLADLNKLHVHVARLDSGLKPAEAFNTRAEFHRVVTNLNQMSLRDLATLPLSVLLYVDENRRSIIHYAAKLGVKDIFEAIPPSLAITLQLTAADTDGNSPLHLAAIGNHADMLDVLVEKLCVRADLCYSMQTELNSRGYTYFHEAVARGHALIAKRIRDKVYELMARKLLSATFWTSFYIGFHETKNAEFKTSRAIADALPDGDAKTKILAVLQR